MHAQLHRDLQADRRGRHPVLRCLGDFPIPQPAAGQTLDLATLAVDYKPGNGGAIQEFGLVGSLAQCAAGKFYIEGGATGTIHLCPATCTAVKADLQAKVSVVSGCARLSEGGGGPK